MFLFSIDIYIIVFSIITFARFDGRYRFAFDAEEARFALVTIDACCIVLFGCFSICFSVIVITSDSENCIF